MLFRSHIDWISDRVVPESPLASSPLYDWVMQTGEPLILPDLAVQPFVPEPSAQFHEVVRGVMAVPIETPGGAVVGALCAFDVRPLTIGNAELEALRSLGYRIGQEIEHDGRRVEQPVEGEKDV